MLSTLMLSLIGLVATSMSVDVNSLLDPATVGGSLLAVAYLYRERDTRISAMSMAVFWGIAVTNILNLPMFLIARLHRPFRDDLIAWFDSVVGIELPQILALSVDFPRAFRLINSCYELLLPLMVLGLLVPVARGQLVRIRQFFLALLISGALGFTLFFFVPVQGPWHTFPMEPRSDQLLIEKVYKAIQGSEHFIIDLRYRAGLIFFPSFHTILPILAVLCLRETPRLLAGCIPLAALIIISTMTTGHHYPSDVYAGILVALVSWYAGSLLEPLLAPKDKKTNPPI